MRVGEGRGAFVDDDIVLAVLRKNLFVRVEVGS
jgi:hypothetical protein